MVATDQVGNRKLPPLDDEALVTVALNAAESAFVSLVPSQELATPAPASGSRRLPRLANGAEVALDVPELGWCPTRVSGAVVLNVTLTEATTGGS